MKDDFTVKECKENINNIISQVLKNYSDKKNDLIYAAVSRGSNGLDKVAYVEVQEKEAEIIKTKAKLNEILDEAIEIEEIGEELGK